MSNIRLICPNLKCRAVLSVAEEARGKVVRCRKCQARVQVPAGKPLRPNRNEEATTES